MLGVPHAVRIRYRKLVDIPVNTHAVVARVPVAHRAVPHGALPQAARPEVAGPTRVARRREAGADVGLGRYEIPEERLHPAQGRVIFRRRAGLCRRLKHLNRTQCR